MKYKFRGKCKDTNEIVVGSLLTIPNACFIVSSVLFETQKEDPEHFSIFYNSTPSTLYKSAVCIYPVYSDSIAQFIGYDKYGDEVYEDDTLIDEDNNLVKAVLVSDKWEIGTIFEDYILRK